MEIELRSRFLMRISSVSKRNPGGIPVMKCGPHFEGLNMIEYRDLYQLPPISWAKTDKWGKGLPNLLISGLPKTWSRESTAFFKRWVQPRHLGSDRIWGSLLHSPCTWTAEMDPKPGLQRGNLELPNPWGYPTPPQVSSNHPKFGPF